MNFLKKLGVSCYINAVAALLILVSMFLTIASSMNVGFSIDELGYVIAFSIIAILAIVGSYDKCGEDIQKHQKEQENRGKIFERFAGKRIFKARGIR